MSSVIEETLQLDEFLQELSRVAYQEPPVPYEMVRQFCNKIVVAIDEGDEQTLDTLRNWFVMLPVEGEFALNAQGEPMNLRALMSLLDAALELVIPPALAREVRLDRYRRCIIEFVLFAGPSMGFQIARSFNLNEEKVHVIASRLSAKGFLTAALVNEQDPGYTWTLTPRGRRLYEAMYR